MNYTQTEEGKIPHLVVRGVTYPIALAFDKFHPMAAPRPMKVTRTGFGLYALPGGGNATASDILNLNRRS